jgi:ATP-dependent exoDNAse (exonuclease V) beta subunit
MPNTAFSIYNASAGSGKTYTLVKEYLKIILLSHKNDAYRNILAITFTNKAVHEMKSRVVETLSEFSKENPSEKAKQLMEQISHEINQSVANIHEKAKNIIKHLIHNYAAFDISTIDKFTHKVIRSFAYELNLPITFEVSLDSEHLLNQAIDEIIAQVGINEALTDLLIDFTREKTDDDKSWNISKDIFETAKLLLKENNQKELAHFNQKSIADFVNIKSKLIEVCKDLESESIHLGEAAWAIIQENNIDESIFSYGTFPNHIKQTIQNTLDIGKKRFLEIDSVSIKKGMNSSLVEKALLEIVPILKQVYGIIEKKNFYQAFIKNLTPLSLVSTINNELTKIQKEQNILSISEFNKLVFEQIQNQPAPFIYEKMGEKYTHFFIDEFQDTSEMQWQNLIPLIDNATSSQDSQEVNGSLLIVGDPKQSIYRWRGGKAEQFIELYKNRNPFNNPDKEVFYLGTNYRSYSKIIAFNNQFFEMMASEFLNEDYRDLYKNNSYQKHNKKEGGYVNISFLTKSETEEENLEEKQALYLLAILEKIKKIKDTNFQNRDIVILTRKKAEGILIANYLIQNGIPVITSESLLLSNSDTIKCVISILKYLDNKNDLLSKADFLYYIAQNLQDKWAVDDFIFQGKNQKTELDFENWLQQNQIAFSFALLRKKSLYETVEVIISKIIPLEKYDAYTNFFLDLVYEQDIKRKSGIADFLKYWETKSSALSIPQPEENDAVKIMTIHKSKGLEFPIVIFPFAEEDYTKGPKEKIWLNASENEIGVGKALVDLSQKVKDFGVDAQAIYDKKTQEDLLDDVNVLYVAFTRAEEQLHIISKMNVKVNGDLPNNMSSYFIKFLKSQNIFQEHQYEYQFGENSRLSLAENLLRQSRIIKPVKNPLKFENIKIAHRESMLLGTKKQEAIDYGDVLHEILSNIVQKEDTEIAILKALEEGLIVLSQINHIKEVIDKVVSHPELADYFTGDNRVLNEKSIISKNGRIVIPDRIVVSKINEVFLLDYKTGQKSNKHEQQLENYQKSIESLGFKVQKKAIVYIWDEIKLEFF